MRESNDALTVPASQVNAIATSTESNLAKSQGILQNTVSDNQVISISLYLKINMTGAEQYANASSSPGNPLFHHFLTPNQFALKFGPSEQERVAVESWLVSEGIANITNPYYNEINFNASIEQIKDIFHTQIGVYGISNYQYFPPVFRNM